MDVKGVTGVNAYGAYTASYTKTPEEKADKPVKEEAAAVFERSSSDEEVNAASKKKTYKSDPDLVAKLKADSEARTSQLKSLVEKIILKQADKSVNIFDYLGQEYSAEDIAQAKEDISEDGYWGVKQTSQRILDFATALTGGDPDKIEEMRSAFEKGYKLAEKTFGGELPDICKQTYDAVFEGFDKMKAEAGIE